EFEVAVGGLEGRTAVLQTDNDVALALFERLDRCTVLNLDVIDLALQGLDLRLQGVEFGLRVAGGKGGAREKSGGAKRSTGQQSVSQRHLTSPCSGDELRLQDWQPRRTPRTPAMSCLVAEPWAGTVPLLRHCGGGPRPAGAYGPGPAT